MDTSEIAQLYGRDPKWFGFRLAQIKVAFEESKEFGENHEIYSIKERMSDMREAISAAEKLQKLIPLLPMESFELGDENILYKLSDAVDGFLEWTFESDKLIPEPERKITKATLRTKIPDDVLARGISRLYDEIAPSDSARLYRDKKAGSPHAMFYGGLVEFLNHVLPYFGFESAPDGINPKTQAFAKRISVL